MRFVPVKTAEQQAALMLLGIREQLVARRTQLSNTIRGYAAEFGLIEAKGLDKIEPLLAAIAQDESVPALARELFAMQAREYARLQVELKAIEAKLLAWHRANAVSRRLAQIPGCRPDRRAAALVMKTPDPHAFRSGRHFAAWLGLTPKDHSTAGKTRLGEITRAGDESLAQRAGGRGDRGDPASESARSRPSVALARRALLKRKPPKLAAVALANKIARIAWKLMATGESYDERAACEAACRRSRRLERIGRPAGYARPAEPELQEQSRWWIDRSEMRDNPWDPLAEQGRVVVWNSCRGNHLGQRS